MADFRDLFAEYEDQAPVWFGIIAQDCTDFANEVPVIIPDFDVTLQWGPCKWQSRNDITLPQKGDQCLIVFDNRREPWIVVWWPF